MEGPSPSDGRQANHVDLQFQVTDSVERVALVPCSCPFCQYTASLRAAEEDAALSHVYSDDDDCYREVDRQYSYGTETGLSYAEKYDANPGGSPRERKPKRNQGGAGKRPKSTSAKRQQYVHFRTAGKAKLRQEERDEKRAAVDTRLEETMHDRLPNYSVAQYRRHPPEYYLSRHEARDSQVRRHHSRSQAVRASRHYQAPAVHHHERHLDYIPPPSQARREAEQLVGAPLLSPGALGMDDETYKLILELQFRDITPNDYDTLGRLDDSVAPKALDKKKLELFPTHTVCEPATEDNPTVVAKDEQGVETVLSQDGCLVCLVEFEKDDELRLLPCGHAFHRECIDEWFERSTKCPTDNLEVKEPESLPEKVPAAAGPATQTPTAALAVETAPDAVSKALPDAGPAGPALAAPASTPDETDENKAV